jgi:hypothetical protein
LVRSSYRGFEEVVVLLETAKSEAAPNYWYG